MHSETTETTDKKRSGLAVASLSLAIISIPTLGLLFIGAILGIVLGAIALKKANSNPEQYGGKGYAIVGIALSGFSLLLHVTLTPLILVFIVQPVRVEGTAMNPTLNNGDRIFVWKQIEQIERGDVVVFWYPKDPSKSFIKRVIGLPGERISIDEQGQVNINGQRVDEPYVSPDRMRSPRTLPPTYVDPHYYFVMGDNRDASNDSRSWGLVPEKYIYGKYAARYAKGD